ncbi:hypothetical protein CDD81_1630 [Ophiocordyceps australis]|uniref:Uncharacterized protein n=1 Tax=Ophiocordyceps australis TaxID=1399860 RepID=A0A2C5XT57_9HYPO|nr:hypothetical protein CDD81_1630 [Ophiocordyceps australis]
MVLALGSNLPILSTWLTGLVVPPSSINTPFLVQDLAPAKLGLDYYSLFCLSDFGQGISAVNMSDKPPSPSSTRLAELLHLSPYTRSGAPRRPHADNDTFANLRARAIATLEAMGFEPETMVELGVLWTHQDLMGHVTHSQFIDYFTPSSCIILTHYADFLGKEQGDDVLNGRKVVPIMTRFSVELKRQVKYPDALIVANRTKDPEPTRIHHLRAIFSLKQQAIVAWADSPVAFVNTMTGRPVNISKAEGNYPALYRELENKARRGRELYEKWLHENPGAKRRGAKL